MPMTSRLMAVTAIVAVGLAASACSGGQKAAAKPPTGSVWVADEGADSLSVIDTSANTLAMTLTGIKGPHNVQTAAAGAVVYATSTAGMVVAIDPATYRVMASAPTGKEPAHVIAAPNGKVYVTNAGDGTVSVYRAEGLVPIGRITLGGMPHGQRAAAGGSVIVIANMMNAALDLVDPATDTSIGSVPVGSSPVQVAVSADGRYAYTGISDPPSVVKVDVMQRKVVGSSAVPATPVQLYLSPDEKTVLCADQGSKAAPGHTLSVIDTGAMTNRGTVDTGSGPHGVVIDTSGKWAWVTNSFDNSVSVIDVNGLSVASTIPVGAEPNGISYSPVPPAKAASAAITLDIPIPPAPAESQGLDPHSAHHS